MLGIAADQSWVNARILPAEIPKEPRQHVLGDGCRGAQGQLSNMFSAQCGNLVLSLDEAREAITKLERACEAVRRKAAA